MKHSIVFQQTGVYAGWPANHGAWQWGDQFLVGFLTGRYKSKSMHNIVEPFVKKLARSHDGGRTWKHEDPGTDFECIAPSDKVPSFSLEDSIIRVCGVYDHGGDYCYEPGGFYLSKNLGHSWSGAYQFLGLDDRLRGDMICTARTRVLGDLIFLSAGQRDIWGTDYVFCARHLPDTNDFQFVSVVCEDNARAVMPAVAKVGDRIVAVMRRRKTAVREGWVDAYGSDDGGLTWRKLAMVGVTGSHNGNPPALVALDDGRLLCAFANRDHGSMVYAISEDKGQTWNTYLMRSQGLSDIGYPQLFKRTDGTPVCVYYWADANIRQQHIAATTLEGV